MNVRHVCKWWVVSTLAAVGLSFGLNKALLAQPVPAGAEEGVEVLTRGPVHEAFAETVTYDPEPGIVTSKAPPAAIEEVPPEHRPEGAHVAWIPGYWGWDDERNDYLWVSGVWRALPPGRQWVPGYWGKSAQGFQWTSGYWANAKTSEVEYLSEPPATVEAGPNMDAPSVDDTWLPGCWVWQNGRYAWRPGYWAPVQQNWVWVPAHYVWAPRGYVFVDGYWDYAIGRRGTLFAPVYFNAGVYGRPGFSYSPSTVIDLGVLANHLFLRPQYQHYYFGDYYAANYGNAGFYPSYAVNSGRFGYDPIFAYNRWQHRQDSGWEKGVAADFLNRRDHEDARPLRTLAAQRAIDARAVQPSGRSPALAVPLNELRTSKDSSLRFQPVDQTERQKFAQRAQEIQQLRDERKNLEANVAASRADTHAKEADTHAKEAETRAKDADTRAKEVETRAKEFAPAKATLPGPPIVARSVADIPKEHVPPRIHEAPAPDLKVEPTPRAVRAVEQPKAERAAPQPQVERSAPQPQPKAERLAPQPQPKAERSAPPPRDNAPAGPNQDKQKGKDKDKN